MNMKLWNDILGAQGYALLKTAFGIEAVELAGAHRPNLILLDIGLPDISGFEVARRLKSDGATRSIPVIALTAFARTEHQREALTSGCDGYISKPVKIIEFLRRVEGMSGLKPRKKECKQRIGSKTLKPPGLSSFGRLIGVSACRLLRLFSHTYGAYPGKTRLFRIRFGEGSESLTLGKGSGATTNNRNRRRESNPGSTR